MAKCRRILRWALALLTAALCLMLCRQAISLYMAGNRPENFSAPGVRIDPVFSRELAAKALLPAAYVFLAFLAALIAALAVGAQEKTGKPAALRFPMDRMRRMRENVSPLPPSALREESRRRKTMALLGCALFLCAVPPALYLLDGEHFTSWDLESVMGEMLLHVAPFAALFLALLYLAFFLTDRSAEREIASLKASPRKPVEPAEKKPGGRRAAVIRTLLYVCAAVFVVLGVLNGGLNDVLVKAINICTECIGLG